MTGTRRPGRAVAWSALLVVLVVALAVGAQRSGSRPSLQQRTETLASQVRCPVCVGETAAESPEPPAVEIRHRIRQELAAGERPSAILAGLVRIYGPGILEKPSTSGVTLLLWVVPVVVVLVAAAGLTAAFLWWGRRRRGSPASAADHDLVAGFLRAAQEGE